VGVRDSTNNTYDANGNLTGSGVVNGADNQVQSIGSTGYLYNQAGNRFMMYSGLTSFDEYYYDNRNRLDEIVAGPSFTTDVQFSYDPANQRIQEEDVNGGTTSYTEFTYDPAGDLLIAQNASGTLTNLYMPDPTGSAGSPQAGGVAPLTQEDANGNIGWLLTDQIGSVP
jgi:YD repeat-containing protein